jgi:hypothetical protein
MLDDNSPISLFSSPQVAFALMASQNEYSFEFSPEIHLCSHANRADDEEHENAFDFWDAEPGVSTTTEDGSTVIYSNAPRVKRNHLRKQSARSGGQQTL